MESLYTLKKQHEDLMQEALRIDVLLRQGQLEQNAREARSALAVLSGKLRVHTAMEDMVIYPTLMTHRETTVSSLARIFNAEMGSLSRDFQDYLRNWPSHASIAGDPARFAKETRAMLKAIERRIRREDEELYPLAETAA